MTRPCSRTKATSLWAWSSVSLSHRRTPASLATGSCRPKSVSTSWASVSWRALEGPASISGWPLGLNLELVKRGSTYISYTLVLDDNWPSRRTAEKLGARICANYLVYRRDLREPTTA